MKKRFLSLILTLCIVFGALPVFAMATTLSDGYITDESGIMSYIKAGNVIDVHGLFDDGSDDGIWIKTTYNNGGYQVARDLPNDASVAAEAKFVNGGHYIQLNYTVTAGDTEIEGGKLAVHSDIMIGDNDRADVEVIKNSNGDAIGLKMADTKNGSPTEGAQFNLYFAGTGGVTPVTTYWFGYFYDRFSYCFLPLNENTKSSSGTYAADFSKLSGADSGFAVSWHNIDLAAGQSETFSLIVGVGEVSDPPAWDSENSVYLTMDAEVDQNNRIVNVSAKAKDADGLTDTLFYSVDGGDGVNLGSVTADGNVKTINGEIDLTDYEPGTYTFAFWIVNSNGAASESVEREITINDDGSIDGLDSGGEAPEQTEDSKIPYIILGGIVYEVLEDNVPALMMPEKPGAFDAALDTYSIYMGDKGFSDVARSDWFYGDVTALANKGVVGGYPDGSFMPYGEVTWGEALKMVMKAVGYGDIAPTGDHWASGYLETALADLLISGEVELDAVITREEVANLTAQALKLAPAGIEYPFDDVAPEAAVALYAAGIIKGSADDGQLLFRAESTITRAEMSAIVWRVYCVR